EALIRRNVTDAFCVLRCCKAPPRAAFYDVLVMVTARSEHCSEVGFGTRLCRFEAIIATPLIAAKAIGLESRHAIGHHARGIAEAQFAPKHLALHMREPRGFVCCASNGTPVLLLNPIDAAINSLAKLREQEPVVGLGLKHCHNRPLYPSRSSTHKCFQTNAV